MSLLFFDVLLNIYIFRKLNEKLDTYNNHLSSINTRLESIETHIKQEKRKGQAPVKPSIIPMQTVQEVIDFDKASDEVYDGLVSSRTISFRFYFLVLNIFMVMDDFQILRFNI